MVADRIATMKQGERTDLSPIGEKLISQAGAAELLNVSKRSVERAHKVRESGAPELIEAVEAGDISVSAAAEIATTPKERHNEELKERRNPKSTPPTPPVVPQSPIKEDEAAELYDVIVLEETWPSFIKKKSFKLPAAPDCHLWIICRQQTVPKAFETLKIWGFRYSGLMSFTMNVVEKKPGWIPSNGHYVVYGTRGEAALVSIKTMWSHSGFSTTNMPHNPNELFEVAVGTPVAQRPPHRSVRAELPHTAPTLGEWRRSAHKDANVKCGHEGANDSQTGQSEPR